MERRNDAAGAAATGRAEAVRQLIKKNQRSLELAEVAEARLLDALREAEGKYARERTSSGSGGEEAVEENARQAEEIQKAEAGYKSAYHRRHNLVVRVGGGSGRMFGCVVCGRESPTSSMGTVHFAMHVLHHCMSPHCIVGTVTSREQSRLPYVFLAYTHLPTPSTHLPQQICQLGASLIAHLD